MTKDEKIRQLQLENTQMRQVLDCVMCKAKIFYCKDNGPDYYFISTNEPSNQKEKDEFFHILDMYPGLKREYERERAKVRGTYKEMMEEEAKKAADAAIEDTEGDDGNDEYVEGKENG